MTSGNHYWEPEVEFILSVIASFTMLYTDVGIEATAYAHSTDTTRHDTT